MANYLHYQIWSRRAKGTDGKIDDLLRKPVLTGVITSGSSMSTPVAVPNAKGQSEYVLVLKSKGAAVYCVLPEALGANPTGTGAHAANDGAQARLLIDPADAALAFTVSAGQKFGVVDAATFA